MKTENKQVKIRTPAQNKAIHKYFTDVANECRAQGITLKQLMSVFELEVDEVVIKRMAQHIGLVRYGKSHTSDMTTKELSDVVDILMKILANIGLETNFPNADFKSILENYQI